MANLSFLCISLYFKGEEFLRSCKKEGNTVYLLTAKKLENKPWPHEAIDEIFYLENDENSPANMADIVKGTAWLMRERKIDAIVALDDFDVEKAATLREEFRVPGMGLTTSRYFRDKLAMRIRAHEAGIKVPQFSALFNDDEINTFADSVPAPWFVKPRTEASATGIMRVNNKDELWQHLDSLGEKRHQYLVEAFCAGNVYHVDSLIFKGEVQFCWSSRYMNTPFEVAHGEGIFRSVSLNRASKPAKQLEKLNQLVMKAFGMVNSASHTEFIYSEAEDEFYFLETSSRVGGAHLAVLVEAASGVNLWSEWAKIETAARLKKNWTPPEITNNFAGILISLARFEHPDMSVFDAPEITWKMNERHHVGFVVASDKQERVFELMESYADLVNRDFHAGLPLGDKPSA